MIQFQENTQTDVRREGWTALCHRIPPATVEDLTSTTAVSWHLKVKDMDVGHIDLGHTKNYSITVSMQKIASIHKLI